MSDLHLDRRALLLTGAGLATTAALTTFEPAAAGTTVTKVFRGRFRGTADLADWHYLPFHVPTGVRRISVSYTYEPKPTGIGTTFDVVDIGIFGPTGFRGWSGGARREFTLGNSSATPGYLAGPVEAGRWRVALGPYQITPTGTPYEVRVTLRFGEGGRPFVPRPAPTSVPGTARGWYRGDLHVHTVHSDGSQTQADVLAYARAAGLDFIGSSDHNTDSAQRTWGRYVDDDFLVIAGEEVTTRAGHWLATGLPAGTWIDWRYRPDDGKLARFTQRVRDLGGLSVAAHPNQAGTGIAWGFSFDDVDAIEVWNGPWGSDDQNAVVRWHNLLTSGTFKPAVGNSDTHKREQTIGLAQTVVRAESLSTEAVIAGYRAGHSWIAESAAVELTFTATLDGVPDVTGECGDHVPSDVGQEVAVHLGVTGVDGCVATLLGPGTATYGTAAAVDGAITLDAAVPGGTAFVRAEVRRGTAMVALTNPIFLTPAA